MRVILKITATVFCFSVLLLEGCTTAVVNPVKGTPTMKQAWYGAMQNNDHVVNHDVGNGGLARSNGSLVGDGNDSISIARGNIIRLPDQRGVLQSAQVKKAQADVDRGFPLLPNPQVVMYLYPHFEGDDQMPVHGNWTTYPLFETNHYALPSEVQT